MNGVLTSENKSENLFKNGKWNAKMEGLNLSKKVSTKQKYSWGNPTTTDFDVRKDILKSLKIKSSCNRFWY